MKTLLVVLVVLLLGSIPASAVLREYDNSITSDRQRMHSQLRETVNPSYSIKELSSANGRIVREYFSPAGPVLGCHVRDQP